MDFYIFFAVSTILVLLTGYTFLDSDDECKWKNTPIGNHVYTGKKKPNKYAIIGIIWMLIEIGGAIVIFGLR